MTKPHKHAELIKAWADGAEIERYYVMHWAPVDYPSWHPETEFRIKPERVFPKTTLSWLQLTRLMWPDLDLGLSAHEGLSSLYGPKFQVIADEVIKQYILTEENKK